MALNLALYGPGVILIREAVLRWQKGWATVILLGAAYAILEEGLAVKTMFTNSTGPPVGSLAVYGRWMEINWVWSTGLLLVHTVFSIALPIMLFGLTFPELKSRSLVTKRRPVAVLLTILVADSILLLSVVPYQPSAGINLLTILVIATLVLIGWRVPANLLRTQTIKPNKSPRFFAALGFFVLPFEILTGGVGAGINWPPALTIAVETLIALLLLFILLRSIGSQENERQKVALAIGLIIPIAAFGFLASLSFPVVLLADLLMALYLRGLWREYGAPVHEEALKVPPSEPSG